MRLSVPLWLVLSLPLVAQSVTRDGYLTDSSHSIDPSSTKELATVLAEIEGRTGYDLAIVVVKKAEGGAQKTAEDLLHRWDKGNFGLVFLLAVEDGEFAFAVAPPLKRVFTPKYCDDLANRCFSGPFSEGRYGDGIVKAFRECGQKIPKYEAPSEDATWYMLLVDGKHAGYEGESCTQGAEGFTTIDEGLVMLPGKDGKPQELRWRNEFVESADGTLIRLARQAWIDRKVVQEINAAPDKGQLLLTVSAGGKEEKKALSMRDDPRFPHGIRECVRRSGLKAGAEFTFVELDFDAMAFLTHDAQVAGLETVEVDGSPTPGVRVKETVSPGGKSIEVIYDPRGVPLRVESPSEKMTLQKASHDAATAGFKTGK